MPSTKDTNKDTNKDNKEELVINSATSAVLAYLQDGGKLTQKDATALFGTTRLAAIICSLKKKGYKIKARYFNVANRFGGNSRIAEYSF